MVVYIDILTDDNEVPFVVLHGFRVHPSNS